MLATDFEMQSVSLFLSHFTNGQLCWSFLNPSLMRLLPVIGWLRFLDLSTTKFFGCHKTLTSLICINPVAYKFDSILEANIYHPLHLPYNRAVTSRSTFIYSHYPTKLINGHLPCNVQFARISKFVAIRHSKISCWPPASWLEFLTFHIFCQIWQRIKTILGNHFDVSFVYRGGCCSVTRSDQKPFTVGVCLVLASSTWSDSF